MATYNREPLNLNIENWSMLDNLDSSESFPDVTDVVSLADNISMANTDDLCDLNSFNYTH